MENHWKKVREERHKRQRKLIAQWTEYVLYTVNQSVDSVEQGKPADVAVKELEDTLNNELDSLYEELGI